VDVQVKLLLQGGHTWEFCCDDEDPILFGLMSALPGADLSNSLPPDGLIQLQTRTGERLFLTRASLVAVDIVPITDEAQILNVNRLAADTPNLVGGVSSTSSSVSARESREFHQVAMERALSQSPGLFNIQNNRPGTNEKPFP
jgi:hypothetical protein